MTWKSTIAAASILLLTSLTGCQSSMSDIIRGQNPGFQQAGYPSGAIIYENGNQTIQTGCPNGNCGHGCDDGCKKNGHGFLHHYHWTYTPPQGLSYPPQNGPSGVVFYPYYTLKGPDDFFYTGE